MSNSKIYKDVIVSGNIPTQNKIKKITAMQSQDVTANWTWYNESQGIVSWNFKNNSKEQKTVILYRSGYYFGNAYWPIYVNNNMTWWATAPLSPLVDKGVENNSMPIGIVDFGNGQRIIAFLFTLAPGQSWSELEGGFSSAMTPTDISVIEVEFEKAGQFCIGYLEEQVFDWDVQTQTLMQGYTPNPDTITTVEVSVPEGAKYVALFNDPIKDGQCPSPPNCMQMLEDSIAKGDIDEFVNAIMCFINQYGLPMKKVVEGMLDKIIDIKFKDEIEKLKNRIEKL